MTVSERKPVVFISISIGWAIRNFFHTGAIDTLKQNFSVVILTTPLIRDEIQKQGYHHDLEFIVLDTSSEPLKWRVFRQLKKKIYLEGRKSSTEMLWRKYKKRPFYQVFGGYVIQGLLGLRLVKAPTLLRWIESLDMMINGKKDLSSMFESYQPCLFLATHASTYFEDSVLKNAIHNKVPSALVVLSWDHLSGKIVLSNYYTAILVWNQMTRSEILQTYPSYKEEQIKVVGISQYDVYLEEPVVSRSEWCHQYGLDPARKTILFSTMPQVRHEQQHIILEELLTEISKGGFGPFDVQVLIKCHPFDNTDVYDPLLSGAFPVSIYRSSLPVGAPQSDWYPTQDEMVISRDCLYYCDININIFSTVTLEAALLDRPIIHVAFDPVPAADRIPCREYYNSEHFKPIVDMQATILVSDYQELFTAISTCLADPGYKSSERKRLVESFLGDLSSPSSDRLAQAVVDLHEHTVKP
ncbi:hypothetical protein ACFL3H_08000 [Gemmatimonadota bacterium]